MTLRIQKSTKGDAVVFALSGRIEADRVEQLQGLFELEAENRSLVLDLRDVTLVDRGTVKFLARCEAQGAKLENCPAYIREWMVREI